MLHPSTPYCFNPMPDSLFPSGEFDMDDRTRIGRAAPGRVADEEDSEQLYNPPKTGRRR